MIYGDVSNMGTPNIIASLKIDQLLSALISPASLTEDQLRALDVNGDGKITREDAQMISDYLARKNPDNWGLIGQIVDVSIPVPVVEGPPVTPVNPGGVAPGLSSGLTWRIALAIAIMVFALYLVSKGGK